MHDLIIRGGSVVDGTGAPARTADVAVAGGKIVEVGRVDGQAAREVDADGLLVAPGWVDIHTHYDGQATWDPLMTPSSWHGVTTVVMGNCGVGFAPVRRDGHDFLIELMEGVEDIPGTALHEGLTWNWETFPEYLDALAAMPRVLDVAAQVPHAALRAYVLGDRAHEDATPAEVAEMARLVGEGIRAGAAGFSTSRFIGHRSKYGLIPGTHAPTDELLAIADAVGAAGRGIIQVVATDVFYPGVAASGARALMVEMARRSGGVVTYTLNQAMHPSAYREALADAEVTDREGLRIVPQVGNRPFGFLIRLDSDLNPFRRSPAFTALRDLPLAERCRRLHDPELRATVLREQAEAEAAADNPTRMWNQVYLLGDPPEYEPHPDTSAGAVAQREGRSPAEVVLDWLLQNDGTALAFIIVGGYSWGDLEATREMMEHPLTTIGGSDAGAHCSYVSDASCPTSFLSFWARDRTRGPRLSIERAIQLQTGVTAETYGMHDRGTIEPGKRADINLIDFDNLHLHAPEMIYDLPASGRRLVQRVDGYVATFVAGEQTFARGEATGARPGALVRFH